MSSKLTDFDPDELDMRTPKSQKDKADSSTPTPRPSKKEKIIKEEILSDVDDDTAGFAAKTEQIFLKEEIISDLENEQDGDSSLDSFVPRPSTEEKIIKEEILSDTRGGLEGVANLDFSDEDDDTAGFAVKPEQIFLKEEIISDLENEQEGDSSLDSFGVVSIMVEEEAETSSRELEVTGVSRSGRVRKKSSKLTDFVLHELDMRTPKSKKEKADSSTPTPRPSKKEKIIKEEILSDTQSLYMMEKSNKKKLVIKDGKIVGRVKAQRNDKGKTRFTSYILWAKEIRPVLTKHNPHLDFSQISTKLGELWASVPPNEKYTWKRQAKKLAAKNVTTKPVHQQMLQSTPSTSQEAKKIKSPQARKFINKQTVPSPTVSTSDILSSPETPKSTRSSVGHESIVFKPIRTTPLDVAAHLRLLGESLTII